jgi:hypothetical protein
MTRFRPIAFALASAALLVLAVAGANTANLLLAQATERTRELAIRQAVGASFWTLVRQWCLQVGLLTALGVGLGTLLGYWAIEAVLISKPQGLEMSDMGLPESLISWRSWLNTVAAALSATFLIGLVVARQAARVHPSRALRDGGGGSIGTTKGRLMRKALIGVQVALASALTFGAGCAYLHSTSQRQAPMGFAAQGVKLLQLPSHAQSPEERAQLLGRLERSVLGPSNARTPEKPLALIDDPPLTRQYDSQAFYREGSARPEPWQMPWGKRSKISAGYFEALDIPIVAGRSFSVDDRGDGPCVVIFSSKLQASAFHGESALGRRINLLPETRITQDGQPVLDRLCEVVGVVGDVYDTVPGGPGELYVAASQWSFSGATLVVPAATGPKLAELLNTVEIRLPPLRERGADILELAGFFLARETERSGVVYGLLPDAVRRLMDHPWPGNVRELSHPAPGRGFSGCARSVRAARATLSLPRARAHAPGDDQRGALAQGRGAACPPSDHHRAQPRDQQLPRAHAVTRRALAVADG